MKRVPFEEALSSFHASTNLVDVKATYNTSFILNDEKKLFGFGDDTYGCLGE